MDEERQLQTCLRDSTRSPYNLIIIPVLATLFPLLMVKEDLLRVLVFRTSSELLSCVVNTPKLHGKPFVFAVGSMSAKSASIAANQTVPGCVPRHCNSSVCAVQPPVVAGFDPDWSSVFQT